jgi:dienelactone hydrolase
MLRILLSLILLGSAALAQAEIRTEEVVYSSGDVDMKGYIAWDASVEGRRPGILVVHEWWGQNEYPRRRARDLAALGYTAMALDMYGNGKNTGHPEEAGAFSKAVADNMESARARFEAALDLLKQHPTVNPGQTGAIGYCFGGGVVLHMARMGLDLDVVASFHGSLPLAIAPGVEKMTTRVAVYNGEADKFIPAEAIEAFKAEMEKAQAHYDFIQLPGALHGFSNPDATAKGEEFGLPLRYDELADQVSWGHMRMVFRDVFGDQARNTGTD